MDDSGLEADPVVRRRAEKDFQAYRRTARILAFIAELFVFVFVLVTSIPALRGGDTRSAVAVLLFGWSVGLLIHALSAFWLSSKSYERGVWQRALARQAALARLADGGQPAEKPKRRPPQKRQLSGDSELPDETGRLYRQEESRPKRQ